MIFQLDADQLEKLATWCHGQDDVYAQKQRKPGVSETLGLPYFGAIGGSLSHTFTPTGIGLVCKVKHNGTQEEIDLSDYDSW